MKKVEKLNVSGCVDCPFAYTEYDDFATGVDSLEICGLAQFNKLELITIKAYDSKEGEEISNDDTPKWCPIKNKLLVIEYV